VVLIILALAALWLRLQVPPAALGADVEVYVRAGRAVLAGREIYTTSAGVLPFTYPPFAALLSVPLAPLGNNAAVALLAAASVLSLAGCVVLVGRTLDMAWAWIVVGTLLALPLEPVYRTMVLGQVNLVLMLLVLADFLWLRPGRRGVLVGVAAGIKLVPAVFVLVYLIRRDWASAIRCAAGFVATVLVGAVLLPRSSLAFWAGEATDLARFGPTGIDRADNQSLAAVWARLTHASTLSTQSVLVAGVLTLAACTALAAAHRRKERLEPVVLVALGGLLASPVSWTHHWVWCVPALCLLAARRQRVAAGLLGVVFWLGPMWLVVGDGSRVAGLGPGEQLLGAAYVLAAAVLFVLLARRVAAPASPGVAESPGGMCDDS
jgi:alpha-1,2-mannosyltransferase